MNNDMIPPSHDEGRDADVPTDLCAASPRSHARTVQTLAQCDPGLTKMPDDDILIGLHKSFLTDQHGEDLLYLQAQTLDALFHRALRYATQGVYKTAPANFLDERQALIALQAQRQCRAALKARASLRKDTTKKSDKQTEGY